MNTKCKEFVDYIVNHAPQHNKHVVENERFASRIGDGNITGLNSHATTNAALVAKQAVVDFYAPDSIPPGQFYNFRTLPAHWSSRHTTYWQHSDHLGSASWVTDTTGRGYEHFQYNAWGGPFITQRITGGDYQSRYTFSGKERDEETGFSYFGSRYYNSTLSIWLSVDPMSDKYPSMSSYTYCANNPVRIVDPEGDSCAVLLAGKAVGAGNIAAGHTAILVQDEKRGNRWFLYSKNGDKTSSGSYLGSADDIGYGGEDGKGYTSVQDFFNKYKNDPRNPDGQGNEYYTEAYILPTSSSQDQKIISGMKQKLYEKYHFTENNCGQAVAFALHNAGIKSKPSMTLRIISIGASVLFRNPSYIMADIKANTTIPKRIYGNIVRANPKGKIFKP